MTRTIIESILGSRMALERPAITVFSIAAGIESMTYGELFDQVECLAQRLITEGVQRGSLVALYMNKSFAQIIALLSILKAGAGFAVLNPRLKGPALLDLFRSGAMRLCFFDTATRININRLCSFKGLPRLIHLRPGRSGGVGPGPPLAVPGVETEEWVLPVPDGQAREMERRLPEVRPNDLACCLFTSGSQGIPKGVLVDHENLCERAEGERIAYGLSPEDTLLSLLPFSFDVGLNQLLSSLSARSHLVILNSWFPADMASAVNTLGITGISAVPKIWEGYLQYLNGGPVEIMALKSLRYITISGGDMSLENLRRLRSSLPGVAIFKTYGQTETFRTSMLMPDEFDACLGSVGRPIPGVRAEIVDDQDIRLPAGRTGLLVHTGKGVMVGYLDECLRARAGEVNPVFLFEGDCRRSCVNTGDVAVMDEEGYIYLQGRRDRMIKKSGFRIYPEEIENLARAEPLVADVAVVVLKRESEADFCAAVVPGRPDLDEREALARLNQILPGYMALSRIRFLDRLPLTANAKVDYTTLETLFLECADGQQGTPTDYHAGSAPSGA